jgi:hypothetical protein
VLEETGIHVVARRLAWVHVTHPTVHANGDHAQYLDHVFRMDWAAGELFPADDESVSARWFDLSTVPHMSADMRRRIELARDDSRSADAVFETKDDPADEDPGVHSSDESRANAPSSSQHVLARRHGGRLGQSQRVGEGMSR